MATDPDEAADASVPEPNNGHERSSSHEAEVNAPGQEDDVNDEEEEDEDDDDEEPKLKYARMTSHLLSVYRNGDATSTFLVAGDKMVCHVASAIANPY